MKVLGIDPGLATTGWGVVCQEGGSLVCAGVGVIETTAGLPLAQRLHTLRTHLSQLIQEHRPAVLTLEQLFFTKFAVSIAATAQARGVILVTAQEYGIPVCELNPRAVKMAMTGFGSASKIQMQTAVQRLLNLARVPTPDDAADALAMALCHLQTGSVISAPRLTRRGRAQWERQLLALAEGRPKGGRA